MTNFDASTGLMASALVMGLAGGAHCVVMCGPVAAVLCGSTKAPSKQSPLVAIGYNLGRLVGYSAIGLGVGWFGSSAGVGSLDVVRFAFRALAVVCLLTVGLHLAGLPSFVRLLESAGGPIWRRVAPFAKRLLPLRTPWHALAAGALWALMPCGLLYGAIALAATAESAIGGALTMAAFGLGTLPIMLGAAAFATRLGRALARERVRRVAGVVMLAFGFWSSLGLASQTGIVGATNHGKHACCPKK